MTFIELVEKVALVSGQPKTVTKNVIKLMTDVIAKEVIFDKRDVQIPGFGKFKIRSVKAGERQVPDGNGGTKKVQVQARDTIRFVAYAKASR
jgi:nucleoid DNA-binding protein